MLPSPPEANALLGFFQCSSGSPSNLYTALYPFLIRRCKAWILLGNFCHLNFFPTRPRSEPTWPPSFPRCAFGDRSTQLLKYLMRPIRDSGYRFCSLNSSESRLPRHPTGQVLTTISSLYYSAQWVPQPSSSLLGFFSLSSLPPWICSPSQYSTFRNFS